MGKGVAVTDENNFIVPPPPGLVPSRTEPEISAESVEVDTASFISLPPGIADSGTYKVPASRPIRSSPEPTINNVVFVPVTPGMALAPVPTPEPAPVPTPAPVAEVPIVAAVQTPAPFAAAGAEALQVAPQVSVPHIEEQFPASADDAGETQVSVPRRAAATWRLVVPGQPAAVLVGSALFIGRNPSLLASTPHATALSVDDPARSVSKTHALIESVGAVLSVTDLGSTNGTFVTHPDGTDLQVLPNEKVDVKPGSTIELGEFEVHVQFN